MPAPWHRPGSSRSDPSSLGINPAWAAGALLVRNDTDEQPQAGPREELEVLQALQPDAVRAQNLVVDRRTLGDGLVDAEGVDANSCDAALLQQEVGGVRAETGEVELAVGVGVAEVVGIVRPGQPTPSSSEPECPSRSARTDVRGR